MSDLTSAQQQELDNALSILKDRYKAWCSNDNRMKSGYEYESSFVKMMQQVEHELLQSSVGKVPLSRNSKKKYKPQ